jgi:hypothetical protein
MEKETLQVFFKGTPRAELSSFPLGSSSITAAVALVDRNMLTRVWDEMDYRTDVYRWTLSICETCKKKKILGDIACISV